MAVMGVGSADDGNSGECSGDGYSIDRCRQC